MIVDDEFIGEVAEILGYKCGSWEVSLPQEICEAVIKAYENRMAVEHFSDSEEPLAKESRRSLYCSCGAHQMNGAGVILSGNESHSAAACKFGEPFIAEIDGGVPEPVYSNPESR